MRDIESEMNRLAISYFNNTWSFIGNMSWVVVNGFINMVAKYGCRRA